MAINTVIKVKIDNKIWKVFHVNILKYTIKEVLEKDKVQYKLKSFPKNNANGNNI